MRSRTALVAGGLYIVLGALFLLERLGAIGLSARFVWPVVLIAVGVAVLLGARRGDREPTPTTPTPPSPPAAEPPPPPGV